MKYEIIVTKDDSAPELVVLASSEDYFFDSDFSDAKRLDISVSTQIYRGELTWKVLVTELLFLTEEVGQLRVTLRYPNWDHELGLQIRTFVGRSQVRSSLFESNTQAGLLVFDFTSLPLDSGENGWTLGVVTSAKDEQQALKCADSLRNAFSQIPHEIIVVGPASSKEWVNNQAKIYRSDILEDLAPIAAKKNLIAAKSNFDKILFVHSRYLFREDFGHQINKRKNRWDVLTFQQQFLDGAHYPHLISNSGGRYLSHATETNFVENLYINGGAFAVKRALILRHQLNPFLFWNEGEDIEWSNLIFSNGYVPRYEPNAVAITAGRASTNVSHIELFRTHSSERLNLYAHLARIRLDVNARNSFSESGCSNSVGFHSSFFRLLRNNDLKVRDIRILFDFYFQVARIFRLKLAKSNLAKKDN
jgi:hypothetical protein